MTVAFSTPQKSVALVRSALLLTCGLLFFIPAGASSFDYTTTDGMRRDTQFVVREMQGLHYSRMPLAQVDFAEFLDNYLSGLDVNRLYFLESDVRQYHMRFSPEVIRGKLVRGDLYPAFQIFKDYQNRALTRIDWVLNRIQRDFNLFLEDTYRINRSEEPWPRDHEHADEVWTQRLTYEILTEVLAAIMSEEDGAREKAEADTEGDGAGAHTPNLRRLEDIDLEPLLKDARKTLTRRYERWQRNLKEIEPSYIHERYLTTLTNLYDPHSTFLSNESLKDFAMSMQNSFVGIGAMLQDDDGFCTIRELLPGGPAEQSRLLEPGDVIIGVAQGDGEMVDVIDMNLRRIVNMIKGEKGTVVRLKIRPAGSMDSSVRRVVSIVRDEVRLTANLASAELFQIPAEGRTFAVGVIELPSFYGGSGKQVSNPTSDVKELIGKLKEMGVEGLILDLRRNGGGLLDEAISLTGLFIPRGPVVQIRDYVGNINTRADKDPSTAWEGPLMVLVSRHSASASEIVAGALQNHRRALIVGDSSTHGKGTVQAVVETNSRSIFPFARRSEPPGAAKITIQKFYLPNGESTQKTGVLSDIALPSINEHLPIGESDLENALIWDSIEPMDWDFSPGSPPRYVAVDDDLIAKLAALSKDRQEQLPEFGYLLRSIEHFRTIRQQEEFSLNLQKRKETRRSERDVQDAMKRELKELASHLSFESEPVILEVRRQQEEISERIRGQGSLRPPSGDAALPGETGEGRQLASNVADPESAVEDDDAAESSPRFDIHLREGLRIMSDWLALLGEGAPAKFDEATLAVRKP